MRTKLESFFENNTMSIHLKEGVIPMAKQGSPSRWEFVRIQERPLTQDDLIHITEEIIETTKHDDRSFIEIENQGSTIVQMGPHRIVITKPPFSDAWEITAVKPIKKLSLEDYELNEKLSERISDHAEGILIAGPPGAGKSTFASAIACYYVSKNKIVKTIEAPRDLVLPGSVTQYALSHIGKDEMCNILLLSRPDYTVFDEIRNTEDFKLFTDLRLSGIGMVGVMHATKAVDAIQRFVGRVELGVIPHVVDTVVFIDKGEVSKVLGLRMGVKVPYGMTESDLARPVIEVFDYNSKNIEFELYTYGEETVVIPLMDKPKGSNERKLATKHLQELFSQYSKNAEVSIISNDKALVKIPEKEVASLIGHRGKTISSIERMAGLSIEVQPIKSPKTYGEDVSFKVIERGNYLIIDTEKPGVIVDTLVEDGFLFTSTTSKKGEIKINRNSEVGESLAKALVLNKKIKLRSLSEL